MCSTKLSITRTVGKRKELARGTRNKLWTLQRRHETNSGKNSDDSNMHGIWTRSSRACTFLVFNSFVDFFTFNIQIKSRLLISQWINAKQSKRVQKIKKTLCKFCDRSKNMKNFALMTCGNYRLIPPIIFAIIHMPLYLFSYLPLKLRERINNAPHLQKSLQFPNPFSIYVSAEAFHDSQWLCAIMKQRKEMTTFRRFIHATVEEHGKR